MKNLSFIASVVSLLISSSAFAAIDCGTLPTCGELGYVDNVAECPRDSNGVVHVIKCPFDKTLGKCIREAAVGQIGYFTKAPGNGWLLCDGSSKSRAQYPELAKFLDSQFCSNSYHLASACSSSGGTFAVPNYKGYFLRVYGSPNSAMGKIGNSSLTTPQKEGLPNITGQFGIHSGSSASGAFYRSDGAYECIRNGDCTGSGITFSASSSSSIYGSSTGVTPPNIAVYAYIYAGKVVAQTTSTKWTCGICGYVHEGSSAPSTCPMCGMGASYFTKN